MGRDRSWVVRITTAECAVELRCSAGGFCSVALQCGFAVGCEDSEDTGFCPLRIIGCAPEQILPHKACIYGLYGTFLLALRVNFGTIIFRKIYIGTQKDIF